MPTNSREDGFTLIELLVVIVILGVLAAIAVPVFVHQRQRGYQAAMRSDLRNAATAEAAFSVSNNGTYTVLASDLAGEGYRTTSGVTPVHVKLVGASYVACVKHSSVASWLVLDGTTGSVTSSSSDCA